ncbi:MAG: alpha/beta hydrolase [Ferruginibacter sp.]|nr:alpha/beta hydrolase [Ferruginibacter sp.]
MNLQKNIAFFYVRMKLNLLYRFSPSKAGAYAFKLFTTPISFPSKNSEIFKKGEPFQFVLKGNKIKGAVFNKGQANKALILHGFSSSKEKFDYYIEPLMKKNYEIWAFDAPAHGESDGKTVNAVEYSEMIKYLHTTIGPMNAFIAHSFGGLALSLALEDTAHNHDVKVVLIAPATETTSAIDAAFQMTGVKNPRIREAIEKKIFEISGKKAEWYSVRRAMRQIKANVLWVHDYDDFTTPVKDALRVKEEGHSHVQFHLTSGLGHSKIYKDHAVIQRISEFL